MKISKISITLFGKRDPIYRVLDLCGNVMQVFTTRNEAQAYRKTTYRRIT